MKGGLSWIPLLVGMLKLNFDGLLLAILGQLALDVSLEIAIVKLSMWYVAQWVCVILRRRKHLLL